MKHKVSAILVILISMAVFAYTATKATVSSFTHDESFSYLHFISQSFMDIISNQGAYSNNHVLNTLGMKYGEIMFGSSEIALRLPNLILMLVFFIYTFLLFRKSDPVLGVCVFILMTTNTALNDFFGLARGYGLSIGFMIMSLYHLISAYNSDNNRDLILFNVGALLAILSNFTMLSFYISSLLVFNITKILECKFISKEKFSFWKLNKVNVVLFLILLIILYEPVRKAVKFNSFDFGGKQGFITDTVTSLIFHVFTNVHLNPTAMMLLQVFVIFIIMVPFIIIVLNTVQSNKAFYTHSRTMIMVNFITLAISIETILQHWILKSDFLVGRFSLFLVLLLFLNFGLLLDYLLRFRYRCLIRGFVVSVALLSSLNFYLNRSLYSCGEWAYDSETKNAIEALINDRKNSASTKDEIKLGINWLFEPTLNYYRQTRELSWLMPIDRNGVAENDDYCYIFMADTGNLRNKDYKVIFSSQRTKTILVKNEWYR